MAADIFFDLDRTLWDFERNSREALTQIFDAHAAQPLSEEWGLELPKIQEFIVFYEEENAKCWHDYTHGRLTKEALRPLRFARALGRLGVPDGSLRRQVADLLGTAYVELSPHLPHLLPGAIETVSELADRGHRLFILTNGFEEVQHIKMDKSGLSPYFEAVYTSDALGHKKPHREAFELALEAAGARVEDSVMIGDDLQADVVGAREVGMRSVHFNPNAQGHGEQVWRTVTELPKILDLPLHKTGAAH